LRTYAAGLKGRIRLLSNTAALVGFLPELMCEFLRRYPDLSVDVGEHPSAQIARAIAKGNAELGIVAEIVDLTGLQTRLIIEDQLLVVMRRGHRLHKQSSVVFADIVEVAFIGLSDAALQVHLGEHASRVGHQMNYRARMRSEEHVTMLVGAGIAILPKTCAGELSKHGLSVSPLNEPWAFRRIYLCARDFTLLTPHVTLLAQQLVNQPGASDLG
jgi:DNA-binding transcriptional LysR family regulator